MTLPIVGQVTVNRHAQLFALFGKLLFVLLNLRTPLFFIESSAIDGLAKMRKRLIRNVKVFVFMPTQVTFGLFNRFFTRCITVCFVSSLGLHSKSDHSF